MIDVRNEPVRVYLGGLSVAVVALLVAYGFLAAATAPLWLALITAGLAVPAIEKARSEVTPVGKVTD